MTPITPNAATPRTETTGTGTRSTMIATNTIRPNTKKQCDQRSGKVVRPLFWESTKEGAMTYAYW